MNALASFIMRGPLQAMLIVVVSGGLSLVFPPVSVLTGAVVALVTLRKGPKAGFTVLFAAAVVLALFAFFAMSSDAVKFAFMVSLLVTVFPVWLLAVVLRSTISLTKTLNTAVILGALMVFLMHATIPDPAAWWQELLRAMLAPTLEAGQLPEGMNIDDNIAAMSVWMTGLVAAAMTVSYLGSLLIGRWMQSILYNPGGFKEEFFALRLSRELAIATLVVIVAAFLLEGGVAAFATDLLWVFGAVYIIPGLAVVHHWISTLNNSNVWLIVLYVLLLFVPQVAVLMAVIGWSDTWVNIRARLSKREGGA